MRLSTTLMSAAALALTLAASPAWSASLATFIGPDSGSATNSCSGDVGGRSGSSTISVSATCFRADVGTVSGQAVAATGHLASTAHADSHNGDSLGVNIEASANYQDLVTFTSTDPTATSAVVSANLLLDGILEAGGPAAGSTLTITLSLAGHDFGETVNLTQDGQVSVTGNFGLAGGTLGPATNALLRTSSFVVPLNSTLFITMAMKSRAAASGPGSHALADFGAHSFKFAATAFSLPDGVTANAGDYIVDNRFIDPLAPAGGVPEPAAWGLMLAGFGLAGSALRRRRDPAPAATL